MRAHKKVTKNWSRGWSYRCHPQPPLCKYAFLCAAQPPERAKNLWRSLHKRAVEKVWDIRSLLATKSGHMTNFKFWGEIQLGSISEAPSFHLRSTSTQFSWVQHCGWKCACANATSWSWAVRHHQVQNLLSKVGKFFGCTYKLDSKTQPPLMPLILFRSDVNVYFQHCSESLLLKKTQYGIV